MKTIQAAAVALLGTAFALTANASDDAAQDSAENEKTTIEEIIVSGHQLSTRVASIAVEREIAVDTAEVFSRLPGADHNMNGRLTGIAQYRGMFGDRVSVNIDGIGVISGGPNAMDAPLSYVSPMITEQLTLERHPELRGHHAVDDHLEPGCQAGGGEHLARVLR